MPVPRCLPAEYDRLCVEGNIESAEDPVLHVGQQIGYFAGLQIQQAKIAAEITDAVDEIGIEMTRTVCVTLYEHDLIEVKQRVLE